MVSRYCQDTERALAVPGCAAFPVSARADFSLPVKDSQVFLAPWNIPLAQLDSQVLSVWRLALRSIPRALRQVHSSGLFPLHPRSASHLHKCDLAVVSLAFKHVNRQEVSSTTLDSAQTHGVSRCEFMLALSFQNALCFLDPFFSWRRGSR